MVVYIDEEEVTKLLRWEDLIPKMESALSQLADSSAVQPNKTFTPVPNKGGVLMTMPSYSRRNNALGCKIATSYSGNREKGLPSVMATVLLLDGDTGKPKAIMDGNTITAWRTAAVSVAATKHLHRGAKHVLCVLGSGVQAKAHIQAMQQQFNFSKIKIWNRTTTNAIKLCEDLNFDNIISVHPTAREATEDADVICTTTGADKPILESEWVKNGAHVNAVGASKNHHSEISDELNKRAAIVVDSMTAANINFADLAHLGVKPWGAAGKVINGEQSVPIASVTIFYPLGLSLEDVLTAELIFERKQRLAAK